MKFNQLLKRLQEKLDIKDHHVRHAWRSGKVECFATIGSDTCKRYKEEDYFRLLAYLTMLRGGKYRKPEPVPKT